MCVFFWFLLLSFDYILFLRFGQYLEQVCWRGEGYVFGNSEKKINLKSKWFKNTTSALRWVYVEVFHNVKQKLIQTEWKYYNYCKSVTVQWKSIHLNPLINWYTVSVQDLLCLNEKKYGDIFISANVSALLNFTCFSKCESPRVRWREGEAALY